MPINSSIHNLLPYMALPNGARYDPVAGWCGGYATCFFPRYGERLPPAPPSFSPGDAAFLRSLGIAPIGD